MALSALGLRDRPLVPVELEPAQRIEDLLDVLRGRALAVRVLDPQHERPARSAGHEPVVECGAGASDVQGAVGDGANRRRGEADKVLIGAHVSTAGGLANAVARGKERGCAAIQIFNQSPRAWRPTAYGDERLRRIS